MFFQLFFAKANFYLERFALACGNYVALVANGLAVYSHGNHVCAFASSLERDIVRAAAEHLLYGAFVPGKRQAGLYAQAFHFSVHTEHVFNHGFKHPGACRRAPALAGCAHSVARFGCKIGVVHSVGLAARFAAVCVFAGEHLEYTLFNSVGSAEHGVYCKLPSGGVQVDTAVILRAGELFSHGADVIVLVGVCGVRKADAYGRFEYFLCLVHSLRSVFKTCKNRPKLRNKEYLAFLAIVCAHYNIVVCASVDIVARFFISAVFFNAVCHYLAALDGKGNILFTAKHFCKLAEALIGVAPSDGKPNGNALALKTCKVHAVVPVAAPDLDKTVKTLEIKEKIYASAYMLVNRGNRTVIKRNFLKKKLFFAELFDYSGNGGSKPNRIV